MTDIRLDLNGDLEIKNTASSNTNLIGEIIPTIYDLNTTNTFIKDLILKAVKTPRGNITLAIPQPEDIMFFDINYGSEIYQELSEGLTLNFLSRIKNHIINALNTAGLSLNINQIEVGALNTNTIQLNISYTDNTPNTFISLNL